MGGSVTVPGFRLRLGPRLLFTRPRRRRPGARAEYEPEVHEVPSDHTGTPRKGSEGRRGAVTGTGTGSDERSCAACATRTSGSVKTRPGPSRCAVRDICDWLCSCCPCAISNIRAYCQ
jgi:hypothetical protein